jgi:hypothetical protein
MTLLGIWLGIKVNQARRQKAAVDKLTALGAQINYEHQRVPSGYFDNRVELNVPEWARELCGDDFFQTVRGVTFAGRVNADRTQTVPYEVTDEDLRCLADLPDLQHLSVVDGPITDLGLSHLSHPEQLVEVSLWDTNIGDDFVRRLKGATRLEGLSINNSRVTDAAFADMPPYPSLKALRLRDTQTGDRALAVFADCNLVVLEVGKNTTDDGVRQFKTFDEIEFFRASDCPITGEAFRGRSFPKADDVHLRNCAVTDETLPPLVEALRDVRVVGLPKCPITDQGLRHLKHLGKTQILVLSGTKIQGLTLSELASMSSIEWIALHDCPLNDPDLKALEPLYSGVAPGVNISLDRTPINDNDVAKISGFTNLNWLGLSHTQITDAALAHLYNLKGLLALDLRGTAVTAEGVKQLKSAIPGALIAWDGDQRPAGWPW